MTKESVDYWSSKKAQNWPHSLNIKGVEEDLVFTYQIPLGLGRWLNERQLFPNIGNLLDIGSGPSTLNVFGDENAARSYAVDVSPYLLAKNRIPQSHKICANIGTDSLPSSLHHTIQFALMSRCSRYLDLDEEKHAASEVYSALQANGIFVVVDHVSQNVDKKIAEARIFDPEEESQILMKAGFIHPVQTSCDIEVYDYKFSQKDYVLYQAVIVRKPYA